MAPSEAQPTDADLAQAFKDVARGERTASAMENQLTTLEHKINDLLASVNDQTDSASASAPLSGQGSDQGPKEGGKTEQ